MDLASLVGAKSQSLCSDTYLSKLLEGLSNLRTKNILCDVTLEAEGVSFSAHKVILAAASNYCKVHFSGDAASHNSHIKLSRVTAQGLQNILSFVYSNKLELTLQNVEETFQAAEMLLVRDVMCLCFRFLEEGLDRHTCLAVLEIAKRLGPKELRQKAMSCVCRHCSHILADPPQLQELDAATLCEICARTALVLNDSQPASWSPVIPFLQVFRFDPRPGSWLQVASMLGRWTCFHAGVLNDCLVAVGGGALLGTLTDTAEEYQPAENKWQPIMPFPMPVADHAGATHKGILYVSGGFAAGQPLRDTYSYLSRLRRWVRNQPMTFARCDHGMAIAGDRIFCIGGRALANAQEWVPVNEMEYYCPVSDQWTLLSLSPFDLCQFGLAVHEQQLYITGGGSVRQKRKEDGVYICNPGGKAWEKAGSLPKALVDHASFFVQLPRHLVAGERQQNGEGPSAAGKKKSTLNLLITSKTSTQPTL
nr:kelch-like protein 36 [Zootoca vivipara]